MLAGNGGRVDQGEARQLELSVACRRQNQGLGVDSVTESREAFGTSHGFIAPNDRVFS